MVDASTFFPKTDPCYSSIEPYIGWVMARVDIAVQHNVYHSLQSDFEKQLRCCPEFRQRYVAWQPGDLSERLKSPDLPPFPQGNVSALCEKYLPDYENVGTEPWQRITRFYEGHWEKQYGLLRDGLQSCCAANAEECFQTVAELGSQAQTSTGQTAQLQAELKTLRQQIHTPRPGTELLAALPAGEVSDGLALLGGFALAAGFLLGLPGRHAWWAKLASGTVVALISLCIYLGVVYLLPDTRPTDLLLALAGALLFASLQALLHLHLSPVRRQDQELGRTEWRPPPDSRAPPAPTAAPAPREPGHRTWQRPPQPPREHQAAPAPPERRESDHAVVVDGYTLVPLDETDRQQRLHRCQGCERIYREASLQQMFRRTGRSCWQCGSRDFREYHFPP